MDVERGKFAGNEFYSCTENCSTH
jgi:hypothetical protein